MESYRGPKSNLRGTNGPVYVEEVGNPLPLTTLVEEAARSIGYNATPDYNSGENMEGFYRFQLNVKNGVRQNTGKTYIKAAKTLPSFTLRTMAHVTRVVFDGIQAVGVAFRDVDASGSPISEEVVVQAKREVILSGGAINTPQLLMLSGIGPKSHLEENGVQVLVDLPGVGENLKDHIIVAEHYLTTENIGIDTFTSKKQLLTQMLKYFVLGTGLAYKSGVEAGMFLRTDKTLSYPDIQYVFRILKLLGSSDTRLAGSMCYPCYRTLTWQK
jgi:choline dehydrogenase